MFQDSLENANIFNSSTSESPSNATGKSVLPSPAAAKTEAVKCGICFRPNSGELASPGGCQHWFHESCLKDYFRCHNVCPIKGCFREAESFVTTSGQYAQIVMHAVAEYRNMTTAPPNFECAVCGKPDINLFRAFAMPCGHVCHRKCLIEFVREHEKCPICLLPTKVIECDVEGTLRFP